MIQTSEMAQWLGMLTAWVQSPESAWWEEQTTSLKLSLDLLVVAC